jgi:hypothetical protein
MEPDIFVKDEGEQFANGETGIEVTLFRHKLMLTEDEADALWQHLSIVLSQVSDRKRAESTKQAEYEAKHEAVK